MSAELSFSNSLAPAPLPAVAARSARSPRASARAHAAPARTRVSAFVLSLVLHGAVLAAGAWIQSGAALPRFTHAAASRPEDAQFAAHIVARADRVEEAVVAPPPRMQRDAIPAPRVEDTVPSLNLDEADEEPPAAAPSIAVDGGAHALAPRDWAPRPSPGRSAFAGGGHGSRREGGQRRGGRGDGNAVAAAVAPVPEPVVEAPAPPPTVRVAARLVKYASPLYPESARDRGLEGSVRLEIEVLADATVGAVRVVESSGVPAFDDAAVAAVRAWRFAPATVDGVAVAATLALPPIRFRLE